MVMLSDSYALAVAYAIEVHASQFRRNTDIPYAAHLLGVSSLVLEAGGDEDLAIAGLLHDAAEDHGGESRLTDIAQRFGPRVAGIVRECSDSLETSEDEKEDWETRKRRHLARLSTASPDALLVWAADKVHNARALVVDLEVHGESALEKFHAPPERVLWYYRTNLELLARARVTDALVVPLRTAVGRMGELIEG